MFPLKPSPAASHPDTPLGLIAGNGSLPCYVVEACLARGRPVVICSVTGEASPIAQWVKRAAPPFTDLLQLQAMAWTEVGRILSWFRQQGVQEVTLAGAVTRPPLHRLVPDRVGMRLLGKLLQQRAQGDDQLLRAVIQFLEEEAFIVSGPHSHLSDVFLGPGLHGPIALSTLAMDDILYGHQNFQTLGRLDIGQSLVVYRGHILAVEAAEGTDRMLQRVQDVKTLLRAQYPPSGDSAEAAPSDDDQTYGGVLMKCPKPNQEARVDLPTIGPETLRAAHQAGVSALAVAHYGTLILDQPEVRRLAEQYQIALYGI